MAKSVPRMAMALALSTMACADLVTTAAPDGDVFDGPVAGLTRAEMSAFARGDAEFERRFAPMTGLGPVFNNVSCASCHGGDGRGRLENALQRIGSAEDDLMRALGGPQIQTRSIAGAEAERVPEGAAVSLRLPPPVFGVGLIEAIPESEILRRADPDDRGSSPCPRPTATSPAG